MTSLGDLDTDSSKLRKLSMLELPESELESEILLRLVAVVVREERDDFWKKNNMNELMKNAWLDNDQFLSSKYDKVKFGHEELSDISNTFFSP